MGCLLGTLAILSGCGDRAPWELVAAIPLIGIFGFALGVGIGRALAFRRLQRELRDQLEGHGVKLGDLWKDGAP